MQFAKITNGKVEKILAGSKLPEEYTAIPNDHQLQVGDSVQFFTREYRRMSVEDAETAELITVGENQTAQWENGQYVIKADYREAKYWKKETGEPVQFQIGDEPDNTMTDIDPEDSEAVWTSSGWEVPADVKAQRLRRERDQLLRDSDYRMLPDYPNSDDEQWKAYRQQLRDMTKQKAFPDSVQWPRAPSGEEERSV